MDCSWIWLLSIFVVEVSSRNPEDLYSHMDHFIQVVKWVEDQAPKLKPVEVVKVLRKTAGLEDPFIHRYLDVLDNSDSIVSNATISQYISKVTIHKVTKTGLEKGVVLTADGTTVALAPVLLGIEAGLLSVTRSRVHGLYPLALTKNLAVSFLHHYEKPATTNLLGTNGCWDSVTSPKIFTLTGEPSRATEALVNGGMDGVILGREVSQPSRHPTSLSSLLKKYYSHWLGSTGLDSAPRLIGRLRRNNFKKLVGSASLRKQITWALATHQKGKKYKMDTEKLQIMVEEGVKTFFHRYMDCPTIIPRCQWGAEPYRGTPTQLSLPLSFMYIHHTHEPGQPCLTFEECSRDMRAMQRFHQEVRGWDDIGYSFVAGSDGYIYEGRGWHWQGAHTLGQNAKGYGVSFIGNYMASLPSRHSQELVRDQLTKCAVSAGRLVPNYIVHGHRQLVTTSCPGDAFYSEIRTWEHFKEVRS
ncbi:peptidoglycan recognition protein 6 [Denticeps clupeoides]|uniref:peptidoglycan recognition protein 6 n=1 Tax=Denticeps clupeoides TaxID=299321 RepID=UPI0010A40668|nr:N-acetylmuramoyl-L-alanine amidase-like [Denticeps clupeoides]